MAVVPGAQTFKRNDLGEARNDVGRFLVRTAILTVVQQGPSTSRRPDKAREGGPAEELRASRGLQRPMNTIPTTKL